jgi:hypothetical protein
MQARLGFLAIVCTAVLTGSAETRAERGKRVVEEALGALGGDRFRHMQDRIESGRAYSFFREQLAGLSVAKIYTRYVAGSPGELAQREREAFGKEGYDVLLFTESGAWEITFRGARPLADLRYETYKDSTLRNIFYILRQRLDEPGLTLYFSQTTKLPVRQSFKRRNPEFKDFDEEVTLFSKYRDLGGGVKWPLDVHRERNGEKIYEMFSDTVEINRDLTDDLFTLPANLRILPKAK